MCRRRGCNSDKQDWMERDARGIPLGTCCADCQEEFLKKFRPSVLTDSNYDAPEQIEPEPEVGRSGGGSY